MLYRLSAFRPHSSPDPFGATLSPGEGIFTAAAAAVVPTFLKPYTALFIAFRAILYYNVRRKYKKERAI